MFKSDKEKVNISKFLGLVLRHKPEVINCTLETGGWLSVSSLLKGIQLEYPNFDMNDLVELVDVKEGKRRYQFSPDKSKVRAMQGHSIDVGSVGVELQPPEVLYHGTAIRFLSAILSTGIKKMNRVAVNLSSDIEDAKRVGARHGDPIILEVATGQMYMDGYKFTQVANGIWLVDYVPVKYIKVKSQ